MKVERMGNLWERHQEMREAMRLRVEEARGKRNESQGQRSGRSHFTKSSASRSLDMEVKKRTSRESSPRLDST